MPALTLSIIGIIGAIILIIGGILVYIKFRKKSPKKSKSDQKSSDKSKKTQTKSKKSSDKKPKPLPKKAKSDKELNQFADRLKIMAETVEEDIDQSIKQLQNRVEYYKVKDFKLGKMTADEMKEETRKLKDSEQTAKEFSSQSYDKAKKELDKMQESYVLLVEFKDQLLDETATKLSDAEDNILIGFKKVQQLNLGAYQKQIKEARKDKPDRYYASAYFAAKEFYSSKNSMSNKLAKDCITIKKFINQFLSK